MINVKDIVYKGLSQVVENVSDAYPQNWSKTPAIQYVEEEISHMNLRMIRNSFLLFALESTYGI